MLPFLSGPAKAWIRSKLLTGTQVPTSISAPAAARDFAIAQPYPLSSATPAINALLPAESSSPSV